MVYYKVIKNGKVIDVLNHILYVKHQAKHDQILICSIVEAEAILSSNGKYGWHTEGLFGFKPDNSLHTITQITKYEYDSLKKKLGMEV